MTMSLGQELPRGAIVSREYEVQLPGGATGSIRFTLADMQFSTGIVLYARRCGATACGAITMVDIPGGTPQPLVWTKTGQGLSIVPTGVVPEFSPQLRSTLSYCLLAFFADVEGIVTDLAAVDGCDACNDNW